MSNIVTLVRGSSSFRTTIKAFNSVWSAKGWRIGSGGANSRPARAMGNYAPSVMTLVDFVDHALVRGTAVFTAWDATGNPMSKPTDAERPAQVGDTVAYEFTIRVRKNDAADTGIITFGAFTVVDGLKVNDFNMAGATGVGSARIALGDYSVGDVITVSGIVFHSVEAEDIQRGNVRMRGGYRYLSGSGTVAAIALIDTEGAATTTVGRGPWAKLPGTSLVFLGGKRFTASAANNSVPKAIANSLWDIGYELGVEDLSASGAGVTLTVKGSYQESGLAAACKTRRKSHVIICDGEEDLEAGDSAATIMARLEGLADDARAAGATWVTCFTVGAYSDLSAPEEAQRVALNALIMADANSKFDLSSDMSAFGTTEPTDQSASGVMTAAGITEFAFWAVIGLANSGYDWSWEI